ncbi:MAG: acyltransferase [Alphaproteobacteria bacterium]|nr:acyltransferase [Alphaproteobacteria bacterium]MBV9372425.1 acyltransferase [Alphaproteobacteria bacterium]MBV9899485.1 acyltransferase [Alphaproteobacteria bacterium]
MTAPPLRRAESELLPLTSIRGIAAWWVVLFHLRLMLAPWLPGWAIAGLGRGNLAVDLFFVLSGFVIHLNYAGRVTRDRAAVTDFLFRRFARVYPLHVLVLLGFLAYAGGAVAFGHATVEGQAPGYFVASLFLVQNWGFHDATRWNVPAWSISAELFAYLLFPILVSVLAPARRSAAVLVGGILALALSVHLFFFAFGLPFPYAIPQTGLFRCVAQFAMGMMLCELYGRWKDDKGLAAPLLLASAALAAAYVLVGAPVVPLVWASLVLGLALGGSGGLLGSRPAVWLGRISYATYLSHYLLLVLFKFAFVEEGRPAAPALLVLYLLAVLAASALLYHGFERPAQRRLLAWWKARPKRIDLAAAAAE